MKIALVMMLAAYYDWLDVQKVSHPFWVLVPLVMILVPTVLVLKQPDLGTALLLVLGGGIVMFAAGVSLWYFGAVIGAGRRAGHAGPGVARHRLAAAEGLPVPAHRHLPRPVERPAGRRLSHHPGQDRAGLGRLGRARASCRARRSRLNFLPEKHTDFIFTTLAEEFGFVGGISLLALYALIIVFCIASAMNNKDRFGIAGDARAGGDLLPVLRGQHVDGDGAGAGGRRAAAAGQLRRHGDADPADAASAWCSARMSTGRGRGHDAERALCRRARRAGPTMPGRCAAAFAAAGHRRAIWRADIAAGRGRLHRLSRRTGR